MEAGERGRGPLREERAESRSLWWYLRHPLATRWTRVPILVGLVFGVTVVTALVFRSHWVECRSLQEWYARTCPVVPRRLLIMRISVVLGVLTIILGPLANSLYRLFRYGQPWETTRHETAVSNIPILAGVAYLLVALVAAWL